MATQDERRNDPVRQEVGARLKGARENKGLSQPDVAAAMNVTKQTVSAWEKGGGAPDVYALRLLVELYGTTADAILFGKTISPEARKLAEELAGLTSSEIGLLRNMWQAVLNHQTSEAVPTGPAPETPLYRRH